MGSVEWITPSTLAIPVMRNSTRIKHVAHLVWLCKKVSFDINKCAGSQTKYNIEYSHLKEPKIPSRASQTILNLNVLLF
jgi:hypothetical protein